MRSHSCMGLRELHPRADQSEDTATTYCQSPDASLTKGCVGSPGEPKSMTVRYSKGKQWDNTTSNREKPPAGAGFFGGRAQHLDNPPLCEIPYHRTDIGEPYSEKPSAKPNPVLRVEVARCNGYPRTPSRVTYACTLNNQGTSITLGS